MDEKTICVYILLCGDGTLYTGWTNRLKSRLAAHARGKGAKYTKARLPVRLVYAEPVETKTQALRREWEIKRLTRSGKLELIAAGNGLPAEGTCRQG